MKYLIRKLAYNYQEGGIGGLLRKTAGYLRRTCWSEVQWLLYVRALEDGVPQVGESVKRRELGFEALRALGYFKARAFPEGIKKRFDDGLVCHGFYADNRLATIGWSSAEYLELEQNVRFECPRAAGLFDFYTFQEFRSRGYYTNALLQLCVVMKKRHFESAYIAVDPRNPASIRGIERAGFRLALRVTRRRRFGMSQLRVWALRTGDVWEPVTGGATTQASAMNIHST